MSEIASAILLILGVGFILTAGVGMLRMPDLFLRTSASTKAAPLGLGCTLTAVAIHFNDLGISSRALATLAFILLTAPIAAHMIGRAAYLYKIPLWTGTVIDELQGHYDEATHALAGLEDPTNANAK
jgi:multicomponent Na+:H+ antiporter subunit G